MIGDIVQPTHLLLILVVALLVLGPKRLPEAGRALGSGLRDFKMALSGERQGSHAEPVSHASARKPIVPAQPSVDSENKRVEPDQPLG